MRHDNRPLSHNDIPQRPRVRGSGIGTARKLRARRGYLRPPASRARTQPNKGGEARGRETPGGAGGSVAHGPFPPAAPREQTVGTRLFISLLYLGAVDPLLAVDRSRLT